MSSDLSKTIKRLKRNRRRNLAMSSPFERQTVIHLSVEQFIKSNQGGISGLRLLLLVAGVLNQEKRALPWRFWKRPASKLALYQHLKSQLVPLILENDISFDMDAMEASLDHMDKVGLIDFTPTCITITAKAQDVLDRFAMPC